MSPRETLLAFAVLSLVFVPLELLFPAGRARMRRPGQGTDLLYFLGQYLVWAAPAAAVLTGLAAGVGRLPLWPAHEALASWPVGARLAAGILLSDLAVYWAHRLAHANPVLWRFHRVHHTSEHLDWLAAHREHPVDNLYTRVAENLPLLVLGVPLELLAGFVVFRGLMALAIHANTTLTPGPLRYLVGASRLHHWHHHPAVGGRVNFANLNPLMDLLFGTFHDPGRFPERYGLDEPSPRGYLGQMIDPFRGRGGSADEHVAQDA